MPSMKQIPLVIYSNQAESVLRDERDLPLVTARSPPHVKNKMLYQAPALH